MSERNDIPGRHLKPVSHSNQALVAYDPYPTGHANEDGIDLREYWRMIIKRKWVVISILSIALVTSLLATALTIPVYRSTAVVQITYESQRILEIRDFTPETRGWIGRDQFFTTQYDILRGRALAEAVVRREGVQEHPELSGEIRQRSLTSELKALPRRLAAVFRPARPEPGMQALSAEQKRELAVRRAGSTLRSRIQITPRRDSNLVNITVSSFDPQFAARMANAVVEEYRHSTMQRRYDAGQAAREFLEEQLADLRIALERADQALLDFGQRNQVADLRQRVEMASTSLTSLNMQLNETQNELVQMRSYRRQIENGRGQHIRLIANDEQINALGQQLSELSDEHARMSRRFQDDYPALADVRLRMNQLESQIAERRDTIVSNVLAEYQNLNSEVATLREAIEEREAGILHLNQQSVQYNILRREFETNRELYDGMLQRMKEIGVAAGVQENNIALIDSALAAGAPFLPNMQRNLAMALLIGLVLGIAVAVLMEFLDTTIRRTEDIEKLVGRPVLGLIPMVKLREQRQKTALGQKSNDRAVSHYSEIHPKSAVSEAFRSLRTSLMFSTPQGMPRTILFTSPGPSDGKTTNAINLATVMAQNGNKVLLIDADLRKPRMHRDFSIPHTPGLTNRIAGVNGGDSSTSAIVPTTVHGLFIMPSGSQAPNPAELLSSERMLKIIGMASRAFDHVIIDTAPVLGLADALVLSRAVDGVIIVAAAGKTSKDSIKASTRRLMQVNAPLLGIVLNQVDLDSPDYAYYSSYYYNYSNDDEHEDNPKALGKTA